MDAQATDSIRVSLVRRPDGAVAATVQVGGHVAALATPIAVGTPDVPLTAAFSPRYEAYAVAALDAAGFEVAPSATQRRSLDEPSPTFIWIVKPKGPGPQVAALRLDFEWRVPESGPGTTPILRQIWSSRLEIGVDQPLFTRGQFSIIALLTGALGSGLNIPFLYGVIKDRLGKGPTGKGQRSKGPARSKK